jgi:hypothetical protein
LLEQEKAMASELKAQHEEAMKHAKTDEDRAKILAENAKLEKASGDKLKNQKAQFEAKMLKQQADLTKKVRLAAHD